MCRWSKPTANVLTDLGSEQTKTTQAAHTTPRPLTVIQGEVYDLTELVGQHPGGEEALRLAFNRDATELFQSVHAVSNQRVLDHWLKTLRVEDPATCPAARDLLLQTKASMQTSEADPFAEDLKTQVRAYFTNLATKRGIPMRDATKATWQRWGIVVTLLIVYLASLLGWFRGQVWALIALPVAGQLYAYNCFHDATHGALSKHAWVNRWMAWTGRATISTPYDWAHQHILGHHVSPNDPHLDPDVHHIQRYTTKSCCWLPLIWLIALPVGVQILAPVRLLLTGKYNGVVEGAPLRSGWCQAYRWAEMATYLSLFYGWPFLVYPPLTALLWVAAPAFVSSYMFMLNTQLAHLTPGTFDDGVFSAGPEAVQQKWNAGGEGGWHRQQAEHSANFGMRGSLLRRALYMFCTGGLNYQVEHHLFPTVNHCHLPGIAPIVRLVCARHGVRYHEFDGYAAGLQLHLRLLRNLKARGAPAPAPPPARITCAAAAGSKAAPSFKRCSFDKARNSKPAANGVSDSATAPPSPPDAPPAAIPSEPTAPRISSSGGAPSGTPSSAAPPPALALYTGTVWHRRRKLDTTHSKADHGFKYSMAWVCADLDQLESGGWRRQSRWLRRARLFSTTSGAAGMALLPRDHLRSVRAQKAGGPGRLGSFREIAEAVRGFVQSAAGRGPAPAPALGRVCLVTQPRMCGYGFNPVSFYYVYSAAASTSSDGDGDGEALVGIVMEVSNTPWDEEHLYVHLCGQGEGTSCSRPQVEAGHSAAALQREAGEFLIEKVFHVSPFMPIKDVQWLCCMPPPGQELSVRIKVFENEENCFTAGVHMERGEASLGALVWCMAVRYPLQPLLVHLLIHLHAAALIAKRCKFFSHPLGSKTKLSEAISFAFHNSGKLLACAAAVAAAAITGSAFTLPGAAAAAVPGDHENASQPWGPSPHAPGLWLGPKESLAYYLATLPRGTVPTVLVACAATVVGTLLLYRNAKSKLPPPKRESGGVGLSGGARGGGGAAAAKERVAVVGSGVSGLGAAHYLNKMGYDVAVFEGSGRLGGHAYTMQLGEGAPSVDLGFQVYNLANYPLLSALFAELGVATMQSEMSFAVSSPSEGIEWSSKRPFATLKDLLNPMQWFLLVEILRFERRAGQLATQARQEEASCGGGAKGKGSAGMSAKEWLDHMSFSQHFRKGYFTPMLAALWSVPPEEVDSFPMAQIAMWLSNHFMLGRWRPKWRTPRYGSKCYVDAVAASLPASAVHLNAKVGRLVPAGRGKGLAPRWMVQGESGESLCADAFDRVVFACHAPQTRQILQQSSGVPTRIADILAGVKTQSNNVVVHSDPSLMPAQRQCWAAWNYITPESTTSSAEPQVVTYWINTLQNAAGPTAARRDIFVTLNPPAGLPAPEAVWHSEVMHHPNLNLEAAASVRQLAAVQGEAGVYVAGAWTDRGFHEDGLRSAAHVASLISQTPVAKFALPLAAPPEPSGAGLRVSRLGRGVYRLIQLAMRKFVKVGMLSIVMPNGEQVDVVAGGRPGELWQRPQGARSEAAAVERLGEVAPGEHFYPRESWTEVTLMVKNEAGLWRLLMDPGMGLAEAYIVGDIDVLPSLDAFFEFAIMQQRATKGMDSPLAWAPNWALKGCSTLWNWLLHSLQPNTVEGSLRNISAHYDLSNDMFQLFLDKTMTYSSGIYAGVDVNPPGLQAVLATAARSARPPPPPTTDELEEAQYQKLDALLDMIELHSSDHVLEVGCGWGSCAIRAVQRAGCRWTAITISAEQRALAQERVKAAGLEHLITVDMCDYRHVSERYGAGSFTKAVSCEVIEAIGHEFLPAYFGAISDALQPGGIAAIQAITVPDERYASYRRGADFIRKYIFPGCCLVCMDAMRGAVERTGLTLHADRTRSLAKSYARTLKEWQRRFEASAREVYELGFDDCFIRMWRYYFVYCAIGFDLRHIDVVQVKFVKDR